LLNEREFKMALWNEQWMADQCGTDQPNPGKPSPMEKKGDDLWVRWLPKAEWMEASKYKFDDKHGYIFHHPGMKAKSGQEGVTMFSGYAAIVQQFEKDGEDETKMLQHAQHDTVGTTTTAAAAPQGTPAVAHGIPPASTAVSTVEANNVTPSVTMIGALVDLTNTTKRKSLVDRVSDLEAAVVGTEDHGPLVKCVEQIEKEMIGNTVAVEASLMQHVEPLERELEMNRAKNFFL
jgi:hypothetical protein